MIKINLLVLKLRYFMLNDNIIFNSYNIKKLKNIFFENSNINII